MTPQQRCLTFTVCETAQHNIHDANASGDVLNIYGFSVCLRRCVEIIAKEGRSLKELYLVSCKITDHGRTFSLSLCCSQPPTLSSFPLLPTFAAAIQDSFDFYSSLPLVRLVNSENIIKKKKFQTEVSGC